MKVSKILLEIYSSQIAVQTINSEENADNTVVLFMNNGTMIYGDVNVGTFTKYEGEEDIELEYDDNGNGKWASFINENVKKLTQKSGIELNSFADTVYLTNVVIKLPSGSHITTDGTTVNINNISNFIVGSRKDLELVKM